MITTENYNFKQPSEEDFYDVVGVANENMDAIDIALKGLDTAKADKTNFFTKEQVTEKDAEILASVMEAVGGTAGDINTHKQNTENPHGVDKADVGLGNVPNYSATSSVTDGSETKFGTAKGVKTAYDRGSTGVANALSAQNKANSAYELAGSKQTEAQANVLYAKTKNTTLAEVNASNTESGLYSVWGADISGAGSYNNILHLKGQDSNWSSQIIISSGGHGFIRQFVNNIVQGVQEIMTRGKCNDSYLAKTAKASDSNLLDGIDSSRFLRSDAHDSMSGNITTTGYIYTQNNTSNGAQHRNVTFSTGNPTGGYNGDVWMKYK